jgi:hypothetical protein
MVRWRYGVFVGAFLALLSLYPQFYLKYHRGEDYNGAAFFFDTDEAAYASYLQALIDGRPRNNDVYSGKGTPQEYETFMTIQFLPAYTVSIPARLLGVSSETVFPFVSVVCAFLTSLSVFWFISRVTGNAKFSAVATLFILLLAAMAAGFSIIKGAFELGSSGFYLPFLRRYTPAAAFPLIFVLISSIWFGLKSSNIRATYSYALIAGACISWLVYSYFFLWTAMLAWLFCIFLLCFLFQPENRKHQFITFWLPIVSFLFVAFIPYLFLLSKRHKTTDVSQILEKTRTLVLFRPTLILGCAIFLATIFLAKAGYLNLKNQLTLFIISFSILPLFVFNQHIITGYSLQPFHYNMYILNYLLLLAFVLLIYLVFKQKLQKINSVGWVFIALLICSWAIIEMHYTTGNRYWFNLRRDEAIPVNRRLAEIAKENFELSTSRITLNFNGIQADNQPTIAPQAVFWSEHLFFLANMTDEEHRRRYFSFLYYQNRDENWLRQSLQYCPTEPCNALFGSRVNKSLSINLQKPTDIEISEVIKEYSEFLKNFSHLESSNPTISYVIAPKDKSADFSKLDLWYKRADAEQHGKYLLYRVERKY